MVKIYVASSWRNDRQSDVVKMLRSAGHEVYDFKNSAPGDYGFSWSEIWERFDNDWSEGTMEQFIEALKDPIAELAFERDFDAMTWADACVMVMPCGRSAHLEAGWFIGSGKPLIILLSSGEPELMYKMAAHLSTGLADVLRQLALIDNKTTR